MAKNTEIPDTKVPSEMLTANLLALLKNWSGYGYELAKKLEEAGYGAYNSGTLYRTLRQMEKNGLISSLWDTSTDGPARRVYSVTSVGTSFL
ncbi:MAG: poly-beta-hydroxybutyrate-responsive repressor, partial [Gammaproteobacteria bacterium]